MSYWRPEPKRHSFAWWALLLPALIYSIGVVVYAHAAFSPADIATNGHAIGSALMVIGGEAGTLAAASEVFRKAQSEAHTANAWDWGGLLVSLVATLGNLFVVYAAIADLQVSWISWARKYGPLALLLCSGFDFYAGIMEFGFYNASFEARWSEWNDAKHRYERRIASEKKSHESEDASESESQSEAKSAERATVSGNGRTPSDTLSESESQSEAVCEHCGRTFGTVNALNAHKRFCEQD